MKKYILIASIAIIAVLNFTLVKSKTGEVTLKSLTELAQANADEIGGTGGTNTPKLGDTRTSERSVGAPYIVNSYIVICPLNEQCHYVPCSAELQKMEIVEYCFNGSYYDFSKVLSTYDKVIWTSCISGH